MKRGLKMRCKRIASGFLALSMTAVLALSDAGAVLAANGDKFFRDAAEFAENMDYSKATSSNASFENHAEDDVVISVFSSEDSDFRSGGMVFLDVNIKNETGTMITDGVLTYKGKGIEPNSAYFESPEEDAVSEGIFEEEAEEDASEASESDGDEIELIDDLTEEEKAAGLDAPAHGKGTAAGDGQTRTKEVSREAGEDSRNGGNDDPETGEDGQADEEEGEPEDDFLQQLEGIELAPGQIYTARFVCTIDESVEMAKNQNIRFRFKGKGEEKRISKEETFRYTVNYLNIDTVKFENGNRVETGEEVIMGIHTSMYDFDAVMADSDVKAELASPSDAQPQPATPSDAESATPSDAEEIAGIQPATPSDADWEEDDSEEDEEDDNFVVDLGKTSYEIQMINAKLNDFQIRKALVSDASENMLICSFRVSKNVKPGVYFGRIIQTSKAKSKSYRSSQSFSLIVTGSGEINLEGMAGKSVVTVTGPVGSFPDANQLAVRVAEVEEEQQAQVDAALEKKSQEEGIEIKSYKALDIKIFADGKETEPTGPIQVAFKNVELEKKASLVEAAAEAVKEIVAPAEEEESAIKVFHLDEEAVVANEMSSMVDEDGTVVMDTDHFSIYVVVDTGKPGGQINLTVQHWGAVETIDGNGTNPGHLQLDTGIDENGRRYGYHTVDDVYNRHTQQINKINAPIAQIYTPDVVTIPNQKQYDNVEDLSKISLATAEKVYADKNYLISEICVSEDLSNKDKVTWTQGTYTSYKVQRDGNGKIINTVNGQNVGITLAKDAVIRFYYTEKTATMDYQPVTFYDHNVSNGGADSGIDAGLNSAENFTGGSYKMGTGQNASGNKSKWTEELDENFAPGIGRLNRANGYDEVGLSADAGIFAGKKTTIYPVIVRNEVLDTLDSNYNLQFNPKIAQPGFFNEKKSNGSAKKGIKRFDNYELGFARKGDTYILSTVRRNGSETVLRGLENIRYSAHNGTRLDGGSWSGSNTNIYSNEFWPLDKESYSGMDSKITNGSDDKKTHNWHFGMRYEFTFRVGDYDGPMNFYFRGDDDFWMFVDGEKVIDLGGIHSAVGQAVDLRAWLESHGGLNRDKAYRMTIYYMERGGFGSCCYMQYTLPNCVPVESPTVPTTDVTVQKIWDDHNNPARPKTIEVELLRNGKVIDTQALSGTGNTWSHTWPDLPTKDVNNSSISYSYEVREKVPAGYSTVTTHSGNAWTITNTLSPEVKAKVVKVWDDKNDQDRNRPDSVAMQLEWSKDNGSTWNNYPGNEGFHEVTSAENWTYEFLHLPKYSGNTEVRYRVRELRNGSVVKLNLNDALPGKRTEAGTNWNYKVTGIVDTVETPTGNNGNLRAVTTITNSYIPQVTYRKVKKTWAEVPGYLETFVKIGLYTTDENGNNPEPVLNLPNNQQNPVTLDKAAGGAANAAYTWKNLPKYRDGIEIKYAIYELDGDNLRTDRISSNGVYTLDGYDYTVDIGNPSVGNTDKDRVTEITNTLLKAKLRLVKEVQNPENLENEPIDTAYKFMINLRENDDDRSLYTSAALGNGEEPDDFIEIIPPHDGKSFMVEEIVPMEYEMTGMNGAWSTGTASGSLPADRFTYHSASEYAVVTVKPGDDITVTVVNVPEHKGYFHHTASVTNTHQGVTGGFVKNDDYKEAPKGTTPVSSPTSADLRAVMPKRIKTSEQDDEDVKIV